jgi:hypothetical protein
LDPTKLTPAQEVDLNRLTSPADAKAMREKKKWTWWRLSIGADGTFLLSTGGKTGVPPGWSRITIAPASPPLAVGVRPAARYRDPEQSGLVFEVRPDRLNECKLHLD